MCALVLHPVRYSLAIGLKWIHFIFELLNTQGLGHSVLPAVKAVTGTDAFAFMVFLMAVVFGTAQTYWALPIDKHIPRPYRSVWARVFFKVFRLELLGDFDIEDLEGENLQIHGNWTGGHLSGQINEARESPLFHDAIMIIILFSSVVVTVLSMNVAIGVVSTAYSKNKANANQLYCHFQAGYVFKLLLYNAALWKFCPDRLSQGLSWCFCCFQKTDEVKDLKTDGYFIGFDQRWFMDSNDLEEDFEDLQNKIEQNRHKLDKIDNLLDNDNGMQVSKHKTGAKRRKHR